MFAITSEQDGPVTGVLRRDEGGCTRPERPASIDSGDRAAGVERGRTGHADRNGVTDDDRRLVTATT